MPLRNFKLTITYLSVFLTNILFAQSFERELNYIPVFDGEGLINNIFSGGHNNLEHQFIDIDNDDDLDIFLGINNVNIHYI